MERSFRSKAQRQKNLNLSITHHSQMQQNPTLLTFCFEGLKENEVFDV